jgi:hypothetical protein
MLLFLLRDHFQEPRHVPQLASPLKGAYANELLASGLVLSAWCALRLLAERGEHFAIDFALALPCLAFGLWAVWHSAGALRSARGNPLAKALRAAKRARRRSRRLSLNARSGHNADQKR